MLEKLKPFFANDAYFYAAFLLLVSVISFGLGRASVENPFTTPNTLQNKAVVPEPLVPNREVGTETATVVVASKSGSKYHLPSCSGAKQIKESNLVQFDSIQAADAAGYAPAANCDFD